MDALDREIRKNVEEAKEKLIVAANPGGPYHCECGGPVVRPGTKWLNPARIKTAVFARVDFMSAPVGIGLHELIDEGIFLLDERRLKIRLNPNFRRTNRFKQLIKEGSRFERSRSRKIDS